MQPETAREDKASPLEVRVHGGITIAVPPHLSAITTYVLLEQESWFEKEVDFFRSFLRPGMTVIDIGANVGIYGLLAAQMVRPDGRVFAYEPGSEARALLAHSCEINGFRKLKIMDSALSDTAREGNLAFAASSELRALVSAGPGDPVDVTSLDIEDSAQNWGSPDLVKIDAEGEEERIIAGGSEFFAKHSPLVMFEIKAGDKVNEGLRAIFPAIGYRLFRQLGGAAILIPDDPQQPLDGYELNMFAAKPDRVNSLLQQGLLVDSLPDWAPSEVARQDAVASWHRQKFVLQLNIPSSFGAGDVDYLDCIAAYFIWRTQVEIAATRCAALTFAMHGLRKLCERAPTFERLSTFARVAWELGARAESVATLQRFLQMLDGAAVHIREPFWPASDRFEDVMPGQHPAEWFAGSAADQLERTASFSSAFSGESPALAWLCDRPFASSEMERRRVLLAARAGRRPKVPARLCSAASDHLNADIWSAGRIPGTLI